ncbi:MAG: hypothetical protein ACRC6F_05535, partial [Aeromonas sp.]
FLNELFERTRVRERYSPVPDESTNVGREYPQVPENTLLLQRTGKTYLLDIVITLKKISHLVKLRFCGEFCWWLISVIHSNVSYNTGVANLFGMMSQRIFLINAKSHIYGKKILTRTFTQNYAISLDKTSFFNISVTPGSLSFPQNFLGLACIQLLPLAVTISHVCQ